MTLSVDNFIAQRTRWGKTAQHDLELGRKETERLGLVDWFKELNISEFRTDPKFVDRFWKECSSSVRDQLWADSGCTYSLFFQSLHWYFTTRDQDWVCPFDVKRAVTQSM
jgi:hypothetical protein